MNAGESESSAGRGRPGAVRIRPAVVADLESMIRVHVDTWKSTYRGLVPDDRLDRMTYDSDRASGFGRWVRDPPPGQATFVAVTPDAEVVGFATCGPTRPPDPEFAGELGAIYIAQSHQGRGTGTALVREVAHHFLNLGKVSLIAWVLERNPYRRFYDHLGGVAVRRRERAHAGGPPTPEIGYGWVDIRALAEPK